MHELDVKYYLQTINIKLVLLESHNRSAFFHIEVFVHVMLQNVSIPFPFGEPITTQTFEVLVIYKAYHLQRP